MFGLRVDSGGLAQVADPVSKSNTDAPRQPKHSLHTCTHSCESTAYFSGENVCKYCLNFSVPYLTIAFQSQCTKFEALLTLWSRIFWQANSCSAGRAIPPTFIESTGPVPCSQESISELNECCPRPVS